MVFREGGPSHTPEVVKVSPREQARLAFLESLEQYQGSCPEAMRELGLNLEEDTRILEKGRQSSIEVLNTEADAEYQIAYLERLRLFLNPELLLAKLDELEQIFETQDFYRVGVDHDLRTLRELARALQAGDDELEKKFKNNYKIQETMFGSAPAMLLNLERHARSEERNLSPEARESMNALKGQARTIVQTLWDKKLLKRPRQDEHRAGKCGTYSSTIGAYVREPKVDDALKGVGIQRIEPTSGFGHHFLRVTAETGEQFYWDPTIEQFVNDPDMEAGLIGFIGTAEEFEDYVNTAIAEKRIRNSSVPEYAYHRYWNYLGKLDRESEPVTD